MAKRGLPAASAAATGRSVSAPTRVEKEFRRVQPARHARVVMAEEELRAALQHQLLAGLQGVGDELDGPEPEARLELAQPGGEEGQGQGVGRREAQRGRRGFLGRARLFPRRREPAEDLLGGRTEPPPGLGQRSGMRAAVDQRGADPILERADAPAEGRLGHVALLGRAGEAPDADSVRRSSSQSSSTAGYRGAWMYLKPALARPATDRVRIPHHQRPGGKRSAHHRSAGTDGPDRVVHRQRLHRFQQDDLEPGRGRHRCRSGTAGRWWATASTPTAATGRAA